MGLYVTKFVFSVWFIVEFGGLLRCRANRICSWHGSSSVSQQSNSVNMVEVNCTEGKIEWKYPKGALMVEIVPPVILKGQQWHICIRPTRRHKGTLLFHLDSDGDYPKDSNLLATNETHCFPAPVDGRIGAKIYVESKPGSKIYASRASFYYSVVKKSNDRFSRFSLQLNDDDQRTFCEPCRTNQLLNHFCKADIVFKGVLLANGDNYVRFTVEKFIRKPIVTIGDDDNEVFTTKGVRHGVEINATVFTPDDCHLTRKLEAMEFLVIAKEHLGRARALCIPLWSDWMTIRRSTLATPSNKHHQQTPCEIT